jgi:hypothetical protein
VRRDAQAKACSYKNNRHEYASIPTTLTKKCTSRHGLFPGPWFGIRPFADNLLIVR